MHSPMEMGLQLLPSCIGQYTIRLIRLLSNFQSAWHWASHHNDLPHVPIYLGVMFHEPRVPYDNRSSANSCNVECCLFRVVLYWTIRSTTLVMCPASLGVLSML